jgi:molybdopterin molybdotransferase
VTSGGASVGDYDLVRSALGHQGLAIDFWQIAMRPGKPLLFGKLGATPVLGLPGNPVSALVCALLFLRPAIQRLLGVPTAGEVPYVPALLGRDLPANDAREDFLRAALTRDENGRPVATPFPTQDSSMLSLLARAGCLVQRPPKAPAAQAGETVQTIVL